MCTLLDVPRSTFYAWRGRVETPTASRRRGLREQVRRVFDTSRQTYGCRRVAAQLNRDGIEVSDGTVAGIMRELRSCAVQPRAYKRTTIAGEVAAIPDLIDRNFTAQVPGARLVGDITYLRTSEGWLHLATVIDLATRMVVGWQTASHMRTSLIVDALQMAVTGGHVRTDAVFHSDRGSQYTSTRIAEFAESKDVRTSVGRTGACWDNAAAEPFFATLKNEMYYRRTFGTRAGHGSRSPSTSRCSTTDSVCIRRWGIVPPRKPSPSIETQHQLPETTESLSKNLDTLHTPAITVYVIERSSSSLIENAR